ncbi:MAG: hypothetical protein ACD_2C00061G0003 [uncultured bacterium (gcode 4)]|uniref:Uncharacterized protein n=1 Tax=uncultured bacterium (gcode 4) TaxID=1234023 RepID=K2G445_9BACT|nr:MAG: hypothetical protein ACD_2C00061G0003 [uncultured bacterium (gcode 4)]
MNADLNHRDHINQANAGEKEDKKIITIKLCVDSNIDDVFRYCDNVKLTSDKRHKRINDSIEYLMHQRKWYQNKLILTTWSDWRRENVSHEWLKSNLEFIMLEKPSLEIDSIHPRSVNDLKSLISKNVSFVLDRTETKIVWIDRLSYFEESMLFPTRIWDSLPIWGNLELYSELRKIVSEELVSIPKCPDKFQKRMKWHKKALNEWKSSFKDKKFTLYDLDKSLLFYDPENANEWVKYWPLRVIQYSLALALIKKIRNIWSHPDFVDHLPTNILDRLDFYLEAWMINASAEETKEIKYIYAYFLKIYHQMQFEFAFSNWTQFLLWKDDIQDMREMLEYLSNVFMKKDTLKI